MKYSKMINKNVENRFTYLFVVVFSVLLFIILCFGGINFHLIATWFTGNTVIIDSPYNVVYYSNFPNGVTNNNSFHIDDAGYTYTVIDNQFDIPNGYEFIGWNTVKDGSGIFYKNQDTVEMSDTLVLYAQWEAVSGVIPDDSNDGNISDDNTGNSSENENDTENSESNDNNDPSLEEDTTNDETNNGEGNLEGDVTVGDSSGSGGTGSSSSSGNGSNESSSNGSSSGNNSGSTTGGSSNNKPSGNGGSSSSNSSVGGNSSVPVLPKKYQFKFIDKDKKFAITNCEVSNNGICDLVLPNEMPHMDGYSFIGWSLTTTCDLEIITGPIKVDSDKIYYACYKVNQVDVEKETKDNKYDILYIILSIWIIASISIYFVIRNFKKNNKNIDID